MEMTKNQVMNGIVRGVAKKMHKPIIDGIVCGVRQEPQTKVGSDIKNVKPSATMKAVGQFGGFNGPESSQKSR
jgi:hypothetical protein